MSKTGNTLACLLALAALGAGAPLSAQDSLGVPAWKGPNGPVDLNLQDPLLIGALDMHTHLDPDISGGGQAPRAMDVVDMARQAQARGMRGFVYKTHLDVSSAASAYLARKAVPGVEVFGRYAMNLSSGGLNPAAVLQFVSIKGGWGRIVEFPTRDARPPQQENRPWVMPWLSLFPDQPKYVPVVVDGQLTSDAKAVLAMVAGLRTSGSEGPVVIATGHATPEGHVLIVREARRLGIPTLVTHPDDTVSDEQYREMKELGAYFEVNLDFFQEGDDFDEKLAFALKQVRRLGAESIIMGTDCGQLNNPLPADCIVLCARALRANGVTERQLDMMVKENPARLLGLPLPGSG